jgi:hypothetical protein
MRQEEEHGDDIPRVKRRRLLTKHGRLLVELCLPCAFQQQKAGIQLNSSRRKR